MSHIQYAQSGFWRRAAAFVIDFIFIAIVWAVATGQAAFQFLIHWNVTSQGLVSSVTSINASHLWNFLAWLIIYIIFSEGVWSKTLGKWLTRQTVVTESKEKPNVRHICVRNIFKLFDIAVGPVIFLFSKKNQSLGDMIAKTYVVADIRLEKKIGPHKIGIVRYVFAVLCILNLGLILYTIDRTVQVNTEVITLISQTEQYVKEKKIEELHTVFVERMRKDVSLKDFKKKIKLTDYNIGTDKGASLPKFYTWKFTDTKIMAEGENEYYIVTVDMEKEKEEWKLVSLKLLPADRK